MAAIPSRDSETWFTSYGALDACTEKDSLQTSSLLTSQYKKPMHASPSIPFSLSPVISIYCLQLFESHGNKGAFVDGPHPLYLPHCYSNIPCQGFRLLWYLPCWIRNQCHLLYSRYIHSLISWINPYMLYILT